MPGRLRLLLMIASLTVAASCSSTTNPSFNVSGTWVGTLTDTIAGVGTSTSTVTQNGTTLSGTYSVVFLGANVIYNNSGTISGSINGTSVTYTATPTNTAFCPSLDTGTLNSTYTTITGSYAAVSGCTLTHQSGTFTATVP